MGAGRFCQTKLCIYDAVKPERSLLKPRITEKVVMVEPIEFPLKKEYERMNGTLEGMKGKERLDGSSMYIEDQKDEDDDDDEDCDGGDGGDTKKLKSKGQTRTDFTAKNETEERVESRMEEMDKGYYPQPDDEGGEGETGSSKDKKSEPPDDGKEKLKHYSEGKPQDGIIYEDDWGERCKIDRRGRPYRVGEDGRKITRGSPRPKGAYTPEQWQRTSIEERDKIKKLIEERKKAERDAKKVEKEIEKLLKEKKKLAASQRTSPIVLPLECECTDLDMYDRLDWPKGVGRRYIDCHKKGMDESPRSVTSLSTDVPDDEEYLDESDEWAEVERGYGPSASWTGKFVEISSGKIASDLKACVSSSTFPLPDGHVQSSPDFLEFPSMPCTPCEPQKHRDKLGEGVFNMPKLFNAMVSRPVGINRNMSKGRRFHVERMERGLHDQGVFDFSIVREYDDVTAEAKRSKTEKNMEYVFNYQKVIHEESSKDEVFYYRQPSQESTLGSCVFSRFGKFTSII